MSAGVVAEAAVCLDWADHRAGSAMPCRICAGVAHLRDELGRPCHKVCAERELAADLRRRGLPYVPATRPARARRRRAGGGR